MTSQLPSTTARRRLDQLPAEAQELLVALSWPPATLRKLLEQALTRAMRKPVRLQGSDADVLASLRHDLSQRNAIGQKLHRQMALRHTLACQRLAPLRSISPLQAAWQQRPPHETAVACLWALLTHPQGPELQDWALREFKQHLYAQAQAKQNTQATETTLQARVQQLQARVQQLQAQADDLRQRLLHQQAKAEKESRELRAALAQAQGANKATTAARASPAAARPERTRATMPWSALPKRVGKAPQPAQAPASAAVVLATHKAHEAISSAPTEEQVRHAPSTPRQSAVQGQRVLCVGGLQHAVARYRSRIESLGGRFEHHDGGIEDNAHALTGRLARADLVICQAGCINHAAYHRIKRHCQKSGTPCLYLERASLSRFDLALQKLNSTAKTAMPT